MPQAPGARTLFTSLNGGRSLRSLAYAHTRAARSRRPGRLAAREQIPTPCRATLHTARTTLRTCATPDHGAVHGGGAAGHDAPFGLESGRSHRDYQQETDRSQPPQRPQEHRAEDGCRQGRVGGGGGCAIGYGGGVAAGPGGRKRCSANEANPAHTGDETPSRAPARPAGRVGETPWYDHEERFLQNEANSAQPTEKNDDPAPLSIPRESPAHLLRVVFHIPQAPGA